MHLSIDDVLKDFSEKVFPISQESMCVYLQRTDSVLSIPKRLGLAEKVVYKFK